jgi:hypothetical protein
MITDFALNVEGAASAMLLFHARHSPLELAEPIFSSLRRRAAHDHAPHKCSLLRQAFLSLADVAIE